MLADELVVLDNSSLLWNVARPLVERAQRLEQGDDAYRWHGWSKKQVNAFLERLPAHCTLLVGVWDVKAVAKTSMSEQSSQEQEVLVLGCVCEVIEGEVHSIRTFEALADASLPPIEQLEPGYQHALDLMRVVRKQVAPVAWALFTDRTTWEEWLFSEGDDASIIDKGELLATFAREGRCVLMGNQATHHP